jgi:hypothetical protein
MSCYVCLEEDGTLLQAKGCKCKGSVSIHESCLEEWLKTATNPFQCTVCKSDYSGTFLTNFMSMEEIMFRTSSSEEQEEVEEGNEFYEFHGIPITESDGMLYFDSEEHKSIYFQAMRKEFKCIRTEAGNRQRQFMRVQTKPRYQNKRRNVNQFSHRMK